MFGAFLSRRRLMTMIGGAMAAPSFLRSSAACAQNGETEDVPDQVVAEILFEESDPSVERLPAAKIKPYWFQQDEGSRPSANWPPDNVSFDYAHLTQFANASDAFPFTPALLKGLLELNSIAPDAKQPKVLFGLRGCALATGADRAAWAKEHVLKATRPNHLDARCLIGVWDTQNDALALFQASTVPNIDLMQKQIEGSLGCNMLPTGLHQYKVGAHRGPRQPGAFRQQTSLWVHRTKKKLVYAANDQANEWDDMDGELPMDDIHAAMLTGRARPPYFSSAGCQVVAGAYNGNKVPTGPWADFRIASGLAHPPAIFNGQQTKDDGTAFDYVLLTGKEAQLISAGERQSLRALRFGSAGPTVVALQEKLSTPEAALQATGVFDRKTLGAVIRWQVANKLAPTGLVTSAMATQLGLHWS